jgi:hypothetical protein
MTRPTPVPAALHSRRRRPSRAPLLLFLLLFVAALGGLYLLGRPRLAFTNRLAGPVYLSVDNDAPRRLAPGESARVTVPWGKTIVAAWQLVRPPSADGRPMGEALRESVVVEGRWGTVSRSAAARSGAGDYFAPLITNASDDLLRVTVNAGLEGGLDCGCAVRPGARRTFIGYYHLYGNSTVQARASGGRRALFRDFGSSVVAPDGTVGLRFETKDLRAR